MEYLLIVDEEDNIIGEEEKEKCHYKNPKLHRAFSVLIFNSKNQMLIQKRSDKKKTWSGFWANACCSSPQRKEEIIDSAKKVKSTVSYVATPKLSHICDTLMV